MAIECNWNTCNLLKLAYRRDGCGLSRPLLSSPSLSLTEITQIDECTSEDVIR